MKTITALFAYLLVSCAALQGGILAEAINLIGQFGTIDLGTGVFTPIGPGTPNGLDGLGGKPGGPFYGVDPVTGHLIRVNTNGSVSDIGDTRTGPNAGPAGVSINASLTSGTMYALDFSNNLLSLNTNSGDVTSTGHVSGLPIPEQMYQGNLFTSLAGNATDLFYTLEVPAGPLQIAPTLYDINPALHTASGKPLIGVSDVIGSGWINGTLYGFTGDGKIVTIDTGTGVGTVVSHYDAGQIPDGPPLTGILGAVAGPMEAPEPASLGLTGLALAAIAYRAAKRGRGSQSTCWIW